MERQLKGKYDLIKLNAYLLYRPWEYIKGKVSNSFDMLMHHIHT